MARSARGQRTSQKILSHERVHLEYFFKRNSFPVIEGRVGGETHRRVYTIQYSKRPSRVDHKFGVWRTRKEQDATAQPRCMPSIAHLQRRPRIDSDTLCQIKCMITLHHSLTLPSLRPPTNYNSTGRRRRGDCSCHGCQGTKASSNTPCVACTCTNTARLTVIPLVANTETAPHAAMGFFQMVSSGMT